MTRSDLENYLKELFHPELYDDYCPNGLQVEGKKIIKKVLFSVSATRESILAAQKENACALIVHHGLFWKFHGTKPMIGPFYERIAPLIKNDINLYAYHLPLDAHLEVGNAFSLATKLGLNQITPFGQVKKNSLGAKGVLSTPCKGEELKEKIKSALNHEVIYSSPNKSEIISTIGIITGGANSEWKCALSENVQAYITGEMSEHDYHEAKEAGIHMFAGGHHATEKWGVISLMNKIKKDFPAIECKFLDSDNPA